MPDKPDKFSWGKGETKITKTPKKLTPEEYDKKKEQEAHQQSQ
jgi:hypothetical protein